MIDPNRQEQARRYATTKRVLFVAELILGAAYLVVLIVSGGAIWLAGALEVVPFLRAGLVAAYFLALFLGYTVLTLPFAVVGSWRLPLRYGLSVQTFGGWLADWLKGNAFGLLLGLIAIEVVF